MVADGLNPNRAIAPDEDGTKRTIDATFINGSFELSNADAVVFVRMSKRCGKRQELRLGKRLFPD